MTTSTLSETEIRLINVDPRGNSNKFYNILVEGNQVTAHYGRVGYEGARTTYSGGDRKAQQLVSQKIRKGYTRQNVVSARIDPGHNNQHEVKKAVSQSLVRNNRRGKNAKLLADLVERLVSSNAHNILEASGGQIQFKDGIAQTPLGILGRDAITSARRILDEVEKIEGKARSTSADITSLEDMAIEYATLVPQNFGMKGGWHKTFWDTHTTASQRSFLDQLAASLDWYESEAKGVGETEEKDYSDLFAYKLDILTDKKEFARIEKMFKDSTNSMHTSATMKLKRVFVIAADDTEFNARAAEIGNVKEFWHGTGVHNVLSIMRKGLFCPKPNAGIKITGRMFGDGVYFSNQSTKALNYATGFWGNGIRRNSDCFMFLADVAMGTEFRPQTSIGRDQYSKLYAGQQLFDRVRHSINVRPGKSGVRNHEAIVWNTDQIRLKYLCEFSN